MIYRVLKSSPLRPCRRRGVAYHAASALTTSGMDAAFVDDSPFVVCAAGGYSHFGDNSDSARRVDVEILKMEAAMLAYVACDKTFNAYYGILLLHGELPKIMLSAKYSSQYRQRRSMPANQSQPTEYLRRRREQPHDAFSPAISSCSQALFFAIIFAGRACSCIVK